MKIVHIATYPGKGQKHIKGSGVASYTKNLVTSTKVSPDDQVYILCDMIGGRSETYTEDGITIRRCFSRSPKFMGQLLRELHRINPDVIHVQQELALFGGILTAYLLQWFLFFARHWQLVLTIHGVIDPKKVDKKFVEENNSNMPVWLVRLAFWLIYKPLTIWPHRIIVHEQHFKQTLVESYKTPQHKIAVIPHGVEQLHADSKQAACQRLGIDAQAKVVLFMGYLTGYKGLGLLIEGFAQFARQNPQAFLIIGAGKHPKLDQDTEYLAKYDQLQQQAKQLIPAGQYRWVGFIPETEIATYYSASDVSVYPYTISMSSSGPMSFAIGFKKPFIASEAFTGIFDQKLLFARTPQALADKLDQFFQQSSGFQQLSRQLEQSRSWAQVGQQTLQLHRELQS